MVCGVGRREVETHERAQPDETRRGAGAAAVRRRYRELALLVHPDKCELPRAEDAFKRVNAAFDGSTLAARMQRWLS